MEGWDIESACKSLGIEALNDIQQEMLEQWHKSDNIVLLSPTGTGKTLAYLLPLLRDIDVAKREVQAVVMVPSRELAKQTAEVVKRLGCGIVALSLYGGRPTMEEHRVLRAVQPHIIICTPGRLNDHLQKGNLCMARSIALVIDEFDKCLELGFRKEMQHAYELLPRRTKQTLLSATDAAELPEFAGSAYLRLNHLKGEARAIDLFRVDSPEKDKIDTLYHLLCSTRGELAIVFVGYRESADRVVTLLKQKGVTAGVMHGAMEQRDRERALYMFANGSRPVLVSTDLAARGLDIAEVKHIIHYHLPQTAEIMVHRNGRTARWDASGAAYLIVGPTEHLPEFAAQAQPFTPKSNGKLTPSPWVTIYIGKGKKDNISRKDVVGFLSTHGKLQREDLGRVDVGDHWAYAAVARAKVKSLISAAKGQKIKGLKTIIEEAK